MKQSPLVSIQMLSYNHADGLSRAIRSVLRQQTNFVYEIIVHDDASTDGSQELLKDFSAQYPGRFKLILREENVYRQRGFTPIIRTLYEHSEGKYIATLECDDEWTDEYKLQAQVDLLETHGEASLCAGGYLEERNSSTRLIVFKKNGELLEAGESVAPHYFFTSKEWSHRWLTKTLTVLYRKDSLAVLMKDISKYHRVRDIHIFYYLLQEGCGIYLTRVLGTYHILDDGMFGSRSRQDQRHQHEHCYRELWKTLRHPVLLRLLIEKKLSFVFHKRFDGQLTIPG